MRRKSFRFLVEDENGKSSTVWNITISKEDIYVTPKIMGKSSKISLHKSGKFSWSLREEYIKSGGKMVNGSRHIAKWEMKQHENNTMNHIFRISIPSSELRVDNKTTDKSCLKIKAPPLGQSTIVDLYLSPSIPEPITHLEVINETSGVVIFRHIMSNRKILLCVQRAVVMSPKDLEQLTNTKLWSKRISEGLNTYGVARITNEEAGISGMLEFSPTKA